MRDQLRYQIAVTRLPGIGPVYTRSLVNFFGSPEAVFQAKRKDLEAIEGIGDKRIEGILKFDFKKVDSELAFIEKHKIRALFYQDADYPQRLLHCFDSPALLFYKGSSDLNRSRIIGIVGTRNPSEYGRSVCEELVRDLSLEDVIIVSGLALGIDTMAHRAAVKYGVETIGVLAHGLDRIYPSQNRNTARQMVGHGGLVTEFPAGTLPDKQNFPSRNRIVAGMCDCVIVIESGVKGGSLITAELANGYNRDVFSVPGRTTDIRSSGCNYLIRTNKAALITSAADVLYSMGWKTSRPASPAPQRQLFIDLSPEDKVIVELIQNGQCHIDELYLKSNLNGSAVAQSLLLLEMQGVIQSLPGKRYQLL